MTIQEHFRVARKLARLLDSQFKVAGFRFGLDPLLGLIPEFGNITTTALSCYLFWLAYKLNVPRSVYLQMITHIGIDFLITTIPILGTASDFFYKSNEKNLLLLSRYVENEVLEGEVIDA